MDMAAGVGEQAPLAERFRLEDVILGLSSDLDALRAGVISVEDARVRAELAKQVMNGVRMVINAQKFLEQRATVVSPSLSSRTEGT